MKNLPMDLLRSFITVAELKGVTQAGELLGRSQPAVSLQIKRLEELVDRSLFIRSGNRLELTPAGDTLFGYARKILALNDEALAAFSVSQVSGRLRFGIPSEFATTLLPKIVGRFTHSYPGVTLEVTSDLSKRLLSEKQRKQFDLILALHDDTRKSQHNWIKVDDLVWVTSREHDIHNQAELPLIVAPKDCLYRKRAIETLDRQRTPWRIVYTIPDLTGIQAAIEEGLGVTVLARSTVPEKLRIIRPGGRFPALGKVGISLVRQGSSAGEAVDRLADYVRASLS